MTEPTKCKTDHLEHSYIAGGSITNTACLEKSVKAEYVRVPRPICATPRMTTALTFVTAQLIRRWSTQLLPANSRMEKKQIATFTQGNSIKQRKRTRWVYTTQTASTQSCTYSSNIALSKRSRRPKGPYCIVPLTKTSKKGKPHHLKSAEWLPTSLERFQGGWGHLKG